MYWIRFDKDTLAVEQDNYLTKVVNVYIVYDLDDWPTNPTKNFKFKNYLYGATSIVKSSDKKSICIVDWNYIWYFRSVEF